MRGSNTRKEANRRSRPRLAVEVVNRQRRRIQRSLIQRSVRLATDLGRWSHGEICVAVVDGPTMRRLNRQYLQHDYVTDVLSFLLERRTKDRFVHGDIVVCAELAVQRSEQLAWKWHDELLLYVVHGALHLIGYNDQSAAQRRRMRAAERKLLAQLGMAVIPGGLPNRSGKNS